jgi:hypothetical protein
MRIALACKQAGRKRLVTVLKRGAS